MGHLIGVGEEGDGKKLDDEDKEIGEERTGELARDGEWCHEGTHITHEEDRDEKNDDEEG